MSKLIILRILRVVRLIELLASYYNMYISHIKKISWSLLGSVLNYTEGYIADMKY